jgi:carbon-monoxide dehydrogenase medium subunit
LLLLAWKDTMNAFDYAAPRTLAEAVALLAQWGDRSRVLAGGSDVLVQMREGRRHVDFLVDAKHVPELNRLECSPAAGLVLGAAVPCYRICEHPEIQRHYPGLVDAVSLVGGVQIQSRASVGGNLCNASPAADTIPALIAHRTVCLVAGPGEQRGECPVESFCVAPGRTVLGPGQLLVLLRLPPPAPRCGGAYLRFIPRGEMDIAVVGAGVHVTLDESGRTCTAARIALAAVAPTPLLVPEAGAALVGTALAEADIEKASAAARSAARPISDMRGDADFRRHLVGVLVRRALTIALGRARGK